MKQAILDGDLELLKTLVTHENINDKFQLCPEDHESFSKKMECTPLIAASFLGRVDLVEYLITCTGLVINETNDFGFTALIAASKRGHRDVCAHLLTHKETDINIQDGFGFTALMHATNKGHPQVVEQLLSVPAINVNTRSVHKATALHHACKKNNLQLVELLLTRADIQLQGEEDMGDCIPILQLFMAHSDFQINHSSQRRGTLLQHAASRGRLEAVHLLVNHPDIDVHARSKSSPSALMLAVQQGHVEIVQVLVTYPGTDIFCEVDKFQRNVFLQAKNIDIVKTFLEMPSCPLNKQDETGCTRLMMDAADNLAPLVKLLLLQPYIDVNIQSEDKHTALSIACKKGFHDIAGLILEREEVVVDTVDMECDISTYQYIVRLGQLELVELFHKRTRATSSALYTENSTALLTACKQGFVEIVEYLLATKNVNINTTDEIGSTPFLAAATGARKQILCLLRCHPNFTTINQVDQNGCTALHLATENNRIEMAAWLAEQPDLDVNATNTHMKNAIHLAIESENDEIFDLLMRRPDLDVNAMNEDLESPLFIAVRIGLVRMTRVLLDDSRLCHDDVNNSIDRSPLKAALQYQNKEILELFVARKYDVDLHLGDELMLDVLKRHLTTASATVLLMRDLPVEISPRGAIDVRRNHNNSWTRFVDSSLEWDTALQLDTIKLVLNNDQYAEHRMEFARQLANTKDKNGRSALQITNDTIRNYLNSLIYFCGRYDIFEGPPIHVSVTSIVVHAYDHGIFSQVFNEHALQGRLDREAFIACARILDGAKSGDDMKQQRGHLGNVFDTWDKSMDGVLSEAEFDRYCEQTYDRRLKVAMKFMQNKHEYTREVQMRDELHDNSCVLNLLPMASTVDFDSNIKALTLHDGIRMITYPNVLVMTAAGRSLEDIYLKERPNDNQIRSMLQEVAMTLQALHANDVVHGDLKKLNIVRVYHHMQLIDMDAATRVGKPVGAKFSSGILPPEMFYELKSDSERDQYATYWQIYVDTKPELWHKVKPHSSWVVRTFDRDITTSLPYELLPASPSIDMWAFGVLMYQMYTGVELVATDINQDVIDTCIQLAATWTQELLHTRIQNKVTNAMARDLIMKLLTVDPENRISIQGVLEHSYFTVNSDIGAVAAKLDSIDHKMDRLKDQVASGLREVQGQVQQVNREVLSTLGKTKADLMRGIFQATEISIPTSFVILPFNVLDKVAEDPEDAIRVAASFVDKGRRMGQKFFESICENKAIGSVVRLVSSGQPLFLYLIDEVQGIPVVPSPATNSMYPIRIDTKSDEYIQFMTAVMPFIQTGFKFLKTANMIAGLLKSVQVPTIDPEVVAEASDKIESAKKTSTVFDFEILQRAVEAQDKRGPVQHIRGAALRELSRFFEKNDPHKEYSGLCRTYAANGQSLWTTKEVVTHMECEFDSIARPEFVSTTPSEQTAQQIFVELLAKHKHEDSEALKVIVKTDSRPMGCACVVM